MNREGYINYQALRQQIEKAFDLKGLKRLCFELDIGYEELPGERLSSKTVSLVEYVRQRNRTRDLIKVLRAVRPTITWPEWETAEPPVSADPILILTPSTPDNPFGRTGQIQNPADYLVRQPLTDMIMHELQKGVSLSVIGQSQSGKSSLLWYITRYGPERLGLPAADFIYLSMELVHSEEDLFDYICSELGIETARGYRLTRQLKGRKVYLCLDEIEKMTWDGFSLNVRTELRGLADGSQAPFTLIIASRSPLDQLFPDSPEMTSPLAGLCMQIRMPSFSLSEAQALVQYYLKATDISLPLEVIEAAWKHSEGHPRNLQIALQKAFDERAGQTDG